MSLKGWSMSKTKRLKRKPANLSSTLMRLIRKRWRNSRKINTSMRLKGSSKKLLRNQRTLIRNWSESSKVKWQICKSRWGISRAKSKFWRTWSFPQREKLGLKNSRSLKWKRESTRLRKSMGFEASEMLIRIPFIPMIRIQGPHRLSINELSLRMTLRMFRIRTSMRFKRLTRGLKRQEELGWMRREGLCLYLQKRLM